MESFVLQDWGVREFSDTDAFISASLSAASTEDSMILLLMRYVMFALKLLQIVPKLKGDDA